MCPAPSFAVYYGPEEAQTSTVDVHWRRQGEETDKGLVSLSPSLLLLLLHLRDFPFKKEIVVAAIAAAAAAAAVPLQLLQHHKYRRLYEAIREGQLVSLGVSVSFSCNTRRRGVVICCMQRRLLLTARPTHTAAAAAAACCPWF